MKAICDEAAGTDSRMYYQNTKKEGWRYIRTSESGKKFQVKRSYGKHTNAIVPYLNWMKENAPAFVKDRLLYIKNEDKLNFYNKLRDLETDGDKQWNNTYLKSL